MPFKKRVESLTRMLLSVIKKHNLLVSSVGTDIYPKFEGIFEWKLTSWSKFKW